MKAFLVGVGAAGNKAIVEAVSQKVIDEKDTVIINTTARDFPKNYNGEKIILTSQNTGCGKERSIAKEYTKKAMADGKFNLSVVQEYDTVIVVTSVEGGTGSGSTPIIAKFFNQVFGKNVHIIAFTGFEDDVRGLANTVEFFKEIDSAMICTFFVYTWLNILATIGVAPLPVPPSTDVAIITVTYSAILSFMLNLPSAIAFFAYSLAIFLSFPHPCRPSLNTIFVPS